MSGARVFERLGALALAVAVLAGSARAESVSDMVDRGNALLAQGKLAEAQKALDEAAAKAPAAPSITFDRACVLSARGNDADAAALLKDVMRSEAPADLISRAGYNLGLIEYRGGVKTGQKDPKAGIEQLRRAERCFRGVLRQNPNDEDAARNVEVTQLAIKKLLDQQKKQNQQQDKNSQNKKDQDKQNKDDKNKDQGKQQQNQQKDQNGKSGQDQKQQPQDGKNSQQDKQSGRQDSRSKGGESQQQDGSGSKSGDNQSGQQQAQPKDDKQAQKQKASEASKDDKKGRKQSSAVEAAKAKKDADKRLREQLIAEILDKERRAREARLRALRALQRAQHVDKDW